MADKILSDATIYLLLPLETWDWDLGANYLEVGQFACMQNFNQVTYIETIHFFVKAKTNVEEKKEWKTQEKINRKQA